MEDGPVIAKSPDVVDPVVGQSDLNVHDRITQQPISKGHEASGRIRLFIGIRLGQAVRYGLLLHGVRVIAVYLTKIEFFLGFICCIAAS